MPRTGMSNRQSPEQEEQDRKRLERPPDAARDRAGHVIRETREERLEEDLSGPTQAPVEESPRSRRERRSRSGG